MEQVFEGIEYSRQDSVPDYGEAFEAEFASQDLKAFQVALLFQEAEQAAQLFPSILMDDSLLQP